MTPYPEIRLIREGNTAASASLSVGHHRVRAAAGGSRLKTACPWPTWCVWRWFALLVQLLAYFLVHRLLPHLPRDVADGKLASGVFLGATADLVRASVVPPA